MTESVGTRRGALGRTFRLLFIAFNLAMLVCIISVGGKLYLESSLATADPPSAGDALAVTRLATLAGIWALGAIILGALSHLTRGAKVEEG